MKNNEIRVTIFDVGQGDSILLEFPGNKIGIIDYYENPDFSPPRKQALLSRLKGLSPKEIEFLCITHPDSDHYQGLTNLLHYFSRQNIRLKSYWCSGWLFDLIKRVKFRSKGYQKEREEIEKLARFFDPQNLKGMGIDVVLCGNLFQEIDTARKLSLPENLRIFALSPLAIDVAVESQKLHIADLYFTIKDAFKYTEMRKRIRSAASRHRSRIKNVEEQILKYIRRPQELYFNHISIALLFQFGKSALVFGGDVLGPKWEEIIEEFSKQNRILRLEADLLKVSHHGGTHGRREETNAIFKSILQNDGYACISVGSGESKHPRWQVLQSIKRISPRLYCTNRGFSCYKYPYHDAFADECVRNIPSGRFSPRPSVDRSFLNIRLSRISEYLEHEGLDRKCYGHLSFVADDEGKVREDNIEYPGQCYFTSKKGEKNMVYRP
jgi:beta-lactamase superfamily II metal-dependent hydrolase